VKVGGQELHMKTSKTQSFGDGNTKKGRVQAGGREIEEREEHPVRERNLKKEDWCRQMTMVYRGLVLTVLLAGEQG